MALAAKAVARLLVRVVLAGRATKSLPLLVGPVVKAAVLPARKLAMGPALPPGVANGLGSVDTVPIQNPVMLVLAS